MSYRKRPRLIKPFGARIPVNQETSNDLIDFSKEAVCEIDDSIRKNREICAGFNVIESEHHLTIIRSGKVREKLKRAKGINLPSTENIIADLEPHVVDLNSILPLELVVNGLDWFGDVRRKNNPDTRTLVLKIAENDALAEVSERLARIESKLAQFGLTEVVTPESSLHISVIKYGQIGDGKRLKDKEKKKAIEIGEGVLGARQLTAIKLDRFVVTPN